MADYKTDIITIVIIEDHLIFRDALSDHLETRPDRFEVVGKATNSEEGLRMVKDYAPDIVLLDLAIPPREGDLDEIREGIRVLREINLISPSTHTVVLTGHMRNDEALFQAIQHGAVAYFFKNNMSGERLIESLLAVAEGNPPVDPQIAAKLWKLYKEPGSAAYSPIDSLTNRELEVLRLISERKDNQQIAYELVISPYTVKKHVSNILAKLKLQSRMELLLCYRSQQKPQ